MNGIRGENEERRLLSLNDWELLTVNRTLEDTKDVCMCLSSLKSFTGLIWKLNLLFNLWFMSLYRQAGKECTYHYDSYSSRNGVA